MRRDGPFQLRIPDVDDIHLPEPEGDEEPREGRRRVIEGDHDWVAKAKRQQPVGQEVEYPVHLKEDHAQDYVVWGPAAFQGHIIELVREPDDLDSVVYRDRNDHDAYRVRYVVWDDLIADRRGEP